MSNSEFKIDPLYTIFEKHLYDFEDEKDSEAAFIEAIVRDYLEFLVKNKVTVPKRWEMQIAEELQDQVRKMLVKKTYGCLSIQEFVQQQKDLRAKKKGARKKYKKLCG